MGYILTRWYQQFVKLRDFISAHVEIQIENGFVAIPESTRTEFYRLFNDVRIAFLEEQFSELLKEVKLLQMNYARTEREIVMLLGLDEVSIVNDVRKFLHDPRDRLMRELFDLLFYLLKGKIEPEMFQSEASKNVKSAHTKLYRLAYQKWVTLSLVKMLEADQCFNLRIPSLEMSPRGPVVIGDSKPVPQPKESRFLSFEHDTTPVFVVPDFVIHSRKLDRYLGFRSELRGLGTITEVMWTASRVSEGREWYNIKSPRDKCNLLALRFALIIYVSGRPEDIGLIADSKKICRPDLIVECNVQDDQFDEDLRRINLYKSALRPKKGIFLVLKDSFPNLTYEKGDGDIHLLTVHFDQPKLGAIVKTLLS